MSTRRLVLVSVLLAAGVVATATLAGSSVSDGTVRYAVTFIPSWNPETHPADYPLTHAKMGLLTPMIGATHGKDYAIFEQGATPTPGLERLSEMGKHDPLSEEINRAIAAGRAGVLIESDTGSPGPVHAPVSLSFEVAPEFPRVSLVGMIAPSPDWFYGVSGVQLQRGGQWLPRLAVEAYAWDSGGDAGATYMAEDRNLEPKAATGYADFEAFRQNGKRVPVGTFVFKRIPADRS